MRNYDVEKEAHSKKEFDLIYMLPEHPNIISAKEFIVTESWTYLVLECADGKELQDYVNESLLSKDNIKKIMIQLLSAIAHLHKHLICHKDIKPENIIFNPLSLSIKIIDFNISQIVKDDSFTMFSCTGTEKFMAPEML